MRLGVLGVRARAREASDVELWRLIVEAVNGGDRVLG
jgi:hypothetical protein